MSIIEEALRRQEEHVPPKPPAPPPSRRILESQDKPSQPPSKANLSWWRKAIRSLYMSHVWPADMQWSPENQIEEIHKWAGTQAVSGTFVIDKMSAFVFERVVSGILKDAPNYVEMKFSKPGNEGEYVVTIVRGGGQTPHEAREKAEGERDALKRELESLKSAASA